MNQLREYKDAYRTFCHLVDRDHPKWPMKKKLKEVERLARQFVVELKLGILSK